MQKVQARYKRNQDGRRRRVTEDSKLGGYAFLRVERLEAEAREKMPR